MTLYRSFRHILLIAICCFVLVPAQAQVERFVEGVHYTRLTSTALINELPLEPGKASVMEVFWYGCSHCYALEPLLNNWVDQHRQTISFSRSPMIWNDITNQHAKLYFAESQLGLNEQLHARIFDAIHNQSHYLVNEDEVAELFLSVGTSQEELDATLNSFAMDTRLRKTKALHRELKVPSVPTLIVNGIWMINGTNLVTTHEQMLEVADFLLTKSGS